MSPNWTLPATSAQTNNVACRYFKRGACRKGDECRYSHNLTSNKPAEMTCRFFQRGMCAFGDRCWFLHTKPAGNKKVPTRQTASLPPPPSDVQPSGSVPGDDTQRSQRTVTCSEAHDEDEEISFATECSIICLGILTYCRHCCCPTCVRKLRRTRPFGGRFFKSGPACQITSQPSMENQSWPEDERQKLVQKFRDSVSTKPCRYFDEGHGRSRFGSRCSYKPDFPDGRPERVRE